MVERRQACKKHFSVFFLQKPDYRPYIFSLHKTAHFLIKRCTFLARGKFFGPGPRGEKFAENTMVERRKACKKYFLVFFYENPNPEATFFVCLKLLISLLNGAFLRRGDNFSVRGCGAKFWATAFHQLFKADSKNPSRLLLRSRFGEQKIPRGGKLRKTFAKSSKKLSRVRFRAKNKIEMAIY